LGRWKRREISAISSNHLEKKDADECMNGIKCIYLGVQVGQFIKNFEIIEKE
jgi:hypothetical protein